MVAVDFIVEEVICRSYHGGLARACGPYISTVPLLTDHVVVVLPLLVHREIVSNHILLARSMGSMCLKHTPQFCIYHHFR